jgi:hypothetical protein
MAVLPVRTRLCLGFAKVEGRWGGGNVFQDALKYIPASLGLGFLPRTVLEDITTTPASTGL